MGRQYLGGEVRRVDRSVGVTRLAATAAATATTAATTAANTALATAVLLLLGGGGGGGGRRLLPRRGRVLVHAAVEEVLPHGLAVAQARELAGAVRCVLLVVVAGCAVGGVGRGDLGVDVDAHHFILYIIIFSSPLFDII